MSAVGSYKHKEDSELITNYDLVAAAHGIMSGIELDVASSKIANEYVEAEAFYTPSDDALNETEWFGNVYLFPPAGTYYWNERQEKWRMTRGTSPTLTSSHDVWFRRLYREWYKQNIKQAVFFSNCPDMVRYDQRIFNFPICFLKTAPILMRNSSNGVKPHKTCTSIVVYLPPIDNSTQKTQDFIHLYEEKGRVVC